MLPAGLEHESPSIPHRLSLLKVILLPDSKSFAVTSTSTHKPADGINTAPGSEYVPKGLYTNSPTLPNKLLNFQQVALDTNPHRAHPRNAANFKNSLPRDHISG